MGKDFAKCPQGRIYSKPRHGREGKGGGGGGGDGQGQGREEGPATPLGSAGWGPRTSWGPPGAHSRRTGWLWNPSASPLVSNC